MRHVPIVKVMFVFVVAATTVRGGIFQWEYIDPAVPNHGKRQSTALAPDGAGATAVPNADLSNRDLRKAYLSYGNLTGADFSRSDLGEAFLFSATLSDATFTGANVKEADFGVHKFTDLELVVAQGPGVLNLGEFIVLGTGISPEQLYSTASYHSGDLRGIGLRDNDLPGVDLARKDLSNADLVFATMPNVDFRQSILRNADLSYASIDGGNFTDADIRGASFAINYCPGLAGCIRLRTGTGISLDQLYSTASYKHHDLRSVNLAKHDLRGGNLAWQNLANANFHEADLTDVDFSGSTIQGANFENPFRGSGITLSQLYSTRSYQVRDLSGVTMGGHFAGGNFSGQNLANASFSNYELTGADLSGADARGALINTEGAVTTNFIAPDGGIAGIDLRDDSLLVLRDYDGDPARINEHGESEPLLPIEVTVEQFAAIADSGTLRLVFEADEWNSTVSFAPGIPVALGGILSLTFRNDIKAVSQIGRTFDVFDWYGVSPTGAFEIASAYEWDTSRLYTSGEVTLIAVPEPNPILLLFHFALAGLAVRSRAVSTVHRVEGEIR